jgi:peptidyl-prolyl cis-trans isomerase C
VNEISDVVETPFGVHILKVTDKRLPRMVSFGEAAPQIERHLSEQRRQEKARLYIERLKTSNKVEILI